MCQIAIRRFVRSYDPKIGVLSFRTVFIEHDAYLHRRIALLNVALGNRKAWPTTTAAAHFGSNKVTLAGQLTSVDVQSSKV